MIVTSQVINIGRTATAIWLHLTRIKIVAFYDPDFKNMNVRECV